jgi:hypothetical protein
MLSLDRGKTWARLQANLPSVRVDEMTIHSRDNAMLVATHGRALWVLDHLEPIQEYASAEKADAKLFTVPTALEWRTKNDRNEEFWGHQYFIGENPPNEAVVQYFLKSPMSDLSLRVNDAAGKTVRSVTIPNAKSQAGINTVCWDMRGEPITAAADSEAAGGGRGGRGGGGGGRGGRGGQAAPGVPQPVPSAGYMPVNPCATPGDSAAAGRGGGGGGGFGGGGGLGGPAPYVMPGTYNVALMSGAKVLDSKPLKIVFDPDVHFAAGEHERYNAIVNDLHAIQRRGVAMATALNSLYPQMTAAAKAVGEKTDIPANVKTQFESLNKEFDAIRKKFGVPTNTGAGGRGGGGGGGRGGAADPENVLARTSTLKNQLVGVWEAPSAASVHQYNDVKLALPKAVADGNAFLGKANSVSQALAKYGVTLKVPASVK